MNERKRVDFLLKILKTIFQTGDIFPYYEIENGIKSMHFSLLMLYILHKN